MLRFLSSLTTFVYVVEIECTSTGIKTDEDEEEEHIWYRLEELAVMHISGSLPIKHRPTIQCYNESTDNSQHPVAVVDELISLQLSLKNPLKIPLFITDIHLLWSFEPTLGAIVDGSIIRTETNYGKEASFNAENNKVVHTKVLPEVTLDGAQEISVDLYVVPRNTGNLHITGVAYKLRMQVAQPPVPPTENQSFTTSTNEIGPNDVYSVYGMQPLKVRGPRLNSKKDDWCNVKYGEDYRLDITVVQPLPRLDVSVHHLNVYTITNAIQLGKFSCNCFIS